MNSEVKAEEPVEPKTENKEPSSGYCLIYAGVRTEDNTYTSPILEVHKWRKSKTETPINAVDSTQKIALEGIQTKRDNADRHLGPSRGAKQWRIELEEEVIVIPIESIISIKYSSKVKKEEQEYKNVRLKTPPPPVKLSCCQRIGRWCSKTFGCCRKDSKYQVYNGPEQIMTTISHQEAERKILITIEYIRYSNIDTPSHTRVLSSPEQFNFFKENHHKDTLEFYLIDIYDFQQDDFDFKRMQASTLCRLITYLKTMIGHYPDEPTLEMIISKQDNLAIGDPPSETFDRLVSSERINSSSELTMPSEVNQNRF